MKCSFSENWEWLPTTDGGERLKNAMTTVVSTLSSPSFECSLAGKNEAVDSRPLKGGRYFYRNSSTSEN